MSNQSQVSSLEGGNQQNRQSKKKNNQQRQQGKPNKAISHVPSKMESELSRLFNRTRSFDGNLPHIETIGQEGVDHINVNRDSKTNLGKLLSTSSGLRFTLFGTRFNSIEHMMLFYRTHASQGSVPSLDKSAFMAWRNAVRAYPNFQNIYVLVCLSYVAIFKDPENAALLEAMNANPVPLDSYSTQEDGKRNRHVTSSTLVRAIYEAHSAVKDDREPNLTVFMFRDLSDQMHHTAHSEGKKVNDVIRVFYEPATVAERFKVSHPDFVAPAIEVKKPNYGNKKKDKAAAPKPAEASTDLQDVHELPPVAPAVEEATEQQEQAQS